MSVTSSALAAGDTNCPDGGSAFTSTSGTTYACNGATGAPWDIIVTAFGFISPGQSIIVVVPCPSGERILGGTFDQVLPSGVTTTSHPNASPAGWLYQIDNQTASSTGFVSAHTYCAH